MQRKKIKIFLTLLTVSILAAGFFFFQNNPETAEAGWWNESWSYRKSIQVTNNISPETDVYISVTLDTSASSSMQSDCGDFRFTSEAGKVLDYYIVSGCGTASNIVHINFDTFASGTQSIYHYYGNPSAENGFSASDFTTEASSYTIGAIGSEETGPGPVSYWSFDEGYGTTAHDNMGNNDGTITGATWQDESSCVVGKCLWFDGIDDKVTIFNSVGDIKTVMFWVKATSTTIDILKLNNSAGISSSNGTISATGFTSPTIYVNSIESTNFSANTWQMIAITSDTAISATSTVIGQLSDYYGGFLDEVKIYPYARNADQVKQDYAAGLAGVKSKKGVIASFGGTSDKWMSDGLVGYWKMDETATTSGAIDSSGNGNTGTYMGSASTTGGKFGNGLVLNGSTDYVSLDKTSGLSAKSQSERTVAMWIKRISGESNTIFMDDVAGYLRFKIGQGSGFVDFSTRDTSTGDTGSIDNTINYSLPLNEWHHMAFVYDANKEYKKIFFDGQEVANTIVSVDSFTSTNSSYIRIGRSNLDFFTGNIDDFRIYNRALSKSEVKKLYEWAPGPVLHLKMDEKQGTTTRDASGNGYDGELIDMASMSNKGWTRGKYGNALDFDGSASYVNLPDLGVFGNNINETDGSLMFWAKLDIDNCYMARSYYLLDFGAGSSDYFSISYDAGLPTKWVFNLRGNSETLNSVVSDCQTASDVNTWNHFTINWEKNGTMELYKNGIFATSSPGTMTDFVGNWSYKIGYVWTGAHFQGAIDDFKIYNYKRTQKQILEDMAGGGSGHSAGLAQKKPLLHLKFDKGYGATAYDSSIYKNNGTVYPGTGGTNTATSAMWSLDGKIGGAMEFDGTDDYVEVVDSSAITNIFDDGGTVSVWIYTTSDGGGNLGRIFDKTNNLNEGWDINVREELSGKVKIFFAQEFSTGDNRWTSVDRVVNLNEWTHIVLKYDASLTSNDPVIFVNGKNIFLSAVKTGSGSVSSDSGNNLYIGNRIDSIRSFDGLIDEVKIWNYALTEDEVKTEYNRGAAAVWGDSGTSNSTATSSSAKSREYCVPGDTSTCNPPVLELTMNERTGTTTYDRSGNGNDGVFVTDASSPTWTRGKNNGGLSFDGNDDSVVVGNIGSNVTSFSFWFKANQIIDKNAGTGFLLQTSTNLGVLMGNSTGYLSNEIIEIRSSGGNSTGWCSATDSISIGWHQLSAFFDGSRYEIYLDGVRKDNCTAGSIAELTGTNIVVGKHSSFISFDGLIDEVRIYDYARTPAQIAWEYNKGKPIGYWNFNECQGATAHDESGNGNDGTINIGSSGAQTTLGTCASSSVASAWYNGESGKVNSSLSFDGVDDWVDVPDDDILDISGNFTLSAWINPDVTNNDDGIICKINTGSFCSYTMGIYSNSLYFGINDYNTISIPFTKSNIWSHIMGVYDGSTVKIFINGEEVSLKAFSTNPTVSTNLLEIGDWNGTADRRFDGQIDEVKIWNYALTAEQVKTEYNGGAVKFGN